MSTFARAVFAALVVATFGAFFVAQRLKNTPTDVQGFGRTPLFSPNGDGRRDGAKLSFLLKQADDVDVDLVTTDGDRVKRLATDRKLPAYRKLALRWDGTDDRGRPVPDGVYRARITLLREGRAITVFKGIRKDTTPPRPRVTSVGPSSAATAELLPTRTGKPATVNFAASGRRPRVTIWRTDGAVPEKITTSGRLADATRSWDWDGTAGGRRVSPGTYLAVADSRDEAGNVGYSVPMRDRRPRLEFGRRLPGRGGHLRALPLRAAAVVADHRRGEGRRVHRRARRALALHAATPRRARRSASAPGRPGPAPGCRSGRRRRPGPTCSRSGRRRARRRSPIIVQANVPVGRVLVVLPWMTWQGRNPVDDDGDGLPNTLEAGLGVRRRPGLRRRRPARGLRDPRGAAARLPGPHAPQLRPHDRPRARPRGTGPKLDEFQGALIPGDARWLPPERRRRSCGASPGRAGPSCRSGPRACAARSSSAPAASAWCGRRARRRPTSSARCCARCARASRDADGRSRTTSTCSPATRACSPRSRPSSRPVRLEDGARLVASAVDGRRDRPVIVAARVGKGLVDAAGDPGLPAAAHAAARERGAHGPPLGPALAGRRDDASHWSSSRRCWPPAWRSGDELRRARCVVARGAADAGAPGRPHLGHERVHPLPTGPPVLAVARRSAALAVRRRARRSLFVRRPTALPLAAVAALPFRVPIAVGGSTSNLLVPLYLVVGGGVRSPTPCRACAVSALDGAPSPGLAGARARAGRSCSTRCRRPTPTTSTTRWRTSSSSTSRSRCCSCCSAGRAVDARLAPRCLGVLGGARARVRRDRLRRVRDAHLLLNPKVIASNQFGTYFRVNSLFFDPNIYGRFLVVVMLAIVAGCSSGRAAARGRRRCRGVLAVLWAGLVLTFSQSSFAALLVGLGGARPGCAGAPRRALRRGRASWPSWASRSSLLAPGRDPRWTSAAPSRPTTRPAAATTSSRAASAVRDEPVVG